jgi:ribosomal protein S18 acetylase RimI-like enzyme
MALDLVTAPALPEGDPRVKVRRVRPPGAFATWVDVVNDALHGDVRMVASAYRAWLATPAYAFYLAYLDAMPVATAATLREGDVASIEFVGTLAAYRRQGAATAACVQALRDLQQAGVRTVTVQSSAEAVSLYERLGFRTYFTLTALDYPR